MENMIPNETSNIVNFDSSNVVNPVTPEIKTDMKPAGGFGLNTMIGMGACVGAGVAITEFVERVAIPVGKKILNKINGVRKAKEKEQAESGDSGVVDGDYREVEDDKKNGSK